MSEFEHSMRAFVRVAKCLSKVFGNDFSLQLRTKGQSQRAIHYKRRREAFAYRAPHGTGKKRRAKKGPFFLVSLFLESIFFHILKIEVRRRENRLIGGSLHLIYEESYPEAKHRREASG